MQEDSSQAGVGSSTRELSLLEWKKVALQNCRTLMATLLSARLTFAPISGDFARELRVPRKKRRRKSKIVLSEKLRGRAENCRRLALGVDDPKFALIWGSQLAHEYETIATEAERLAVNSKFNFVEATKFRYNIRLSAYRRKRRLFPRVRS